MTTKLARFQGPRNSGSMAVGFSLLIVFSQLALHGLSQYCWILPASGEQVVRLVPATSICQLLVNGTPVGGGLAGLCPWVGLLGAAVRLLCGAL